MNEQNKPTIPLDHPIRISDDDRLDRARLAEKFVQQVLELDASEGATVGLFGSWGLGKTSFINLARGESDQENCPARKTFKRAGVPVFEFNPWMFSGTEQLVERFFVELSIAMGATNNFKDYGKILLTYAHKIGYLAKTLVSNLALEPGTKNLVEASGNVLLEKIDRVIEEQESVFTLRKKITETLRERKGKIIVILDDVDRLSTFEIREIFKLVRLTANFPYIIYIIPCDRERIEQALGEEGMPGRDYLEKIIQYPFKLPEVPKHLLEEYLLEEINNSLANIENPGPFDSYIWQNEVLPGIIRPLIRNMRDVRRYAIAIRETISGLDGKVALADVLALEAVRIFLPDTFELLPSSIDFLTVTSHESEKRGSTTEHFKSRHREKIKAMIPDIDTIQNSKDAKITTKISDAWIANEVVVWMILHLFPAAALLYNTNDGDEKISEKEVTKLLKNRRVGHGHILQLYLERVVGPDLLDVHDIERCIEYISDPKDFDRFLRSLSPVRWKNVVFKLRKHKSSFHPQYVKPCIIVLLNLWPYMVERSNWNFAEHAGHAVQITISQLLSTFEDTSFAEDTIRHIWPELNSLSSKLVLFRSMGIVNGQKIVSEHTKNEFKMGLQNEIRKLPADNFAEEYIPTEILRFANYRIESWEKRLEIGQSPKLTLALLLNSRYDLPAIHTPRRLAILHSNELNWNDLIKIYGTEEVLKKRINDLKIRFEELKPWIKKRNIPIDEAERVINIAEKYANGWLPDFVEF